MLGLATSLAKGGASLLNYVKDNLKLYIDFKSTKSYTLKFPCEGSTSFNGTNQQIELSDAGFPSGNSPFTISCWFNKTASVSYAALVSWGTASNNNANYLNLDNANHVKAGFYSNDLENGSGTDTSAGTWYHATVTYDGTTRRIYVNGSEEVNDTPSSVNVTLGGTLYIGTFFGTYDFNGKIANVGVWSRALSAEEVNSVMRKNYSQLGSVEKTSLVMWQSLDSRSTTGGAKEVVTPSSGEVLGDELVDNLNGTTSGWDAMSGNALSVNTYDHGTYVVCIYNQSEGDNVNAMRFYLGSSGTGSALSENVEVGALYKISMTGYIGGTTTSYPVSSDSGVRAEGSSWGANAENVSTKTFYYKATNASGNIIYPFYELGSYTTEGMAFIKDVSVKKVLSISGQITGATTTTSVYGGNAPVLPRAVDVAREGEAEQIGDGSASFTASNTDYIETSSNIGISGSQARTVTAWVNGNNATDHQKIVSWGANTSNNMFMLERRNDDDLYLDVHGTNLDSGVDITDGEWTHIAVTFDGTNKIILYKNGINVGESTSFSSVNTTNSVVSIGRKGSGADTHYYDGYLSQIGIWAGALTQAQIQSVMESTSYAKIPASVKSTLGDSDWNLTANGGSTGTGNTTADGVITFADNGYHFFSGISNSTLYKVQYTVVTATTTYAGAMTFAGGSSAFGAMDLDSSVGTHTYYLVSVNTTLSLRSVGFRGTITDYTAKPVTNDLVGYWALDADNSANGVTNDVTTGEVLGVEKVTLLSNWTGSDYTSTITASTNTINIEADDSSVNATRYLSSAGGIVTGTTNLSAGLYKVSFDASWTNAPNIKQFKWYSDGSTVTTETIASGSNVFYKTTTTANGNSHFNIQMNNANQGITLSNISIKEVTSNTGVLY